MDVSQLPDISGMLVTPDNPARDPAGGMDTARCVALHNYLVLYTWVAQGCPPAAMHAGTSTTYFTAHGAAAEVLRPRLHPSLAAFLDAAILPPDGPPRTPLFIWADHFCSPEELFDNITADLKDMLPDSLVNLHYPGHGGESGGGVFYHQASHSAAVFMHMDDHDYAFPVDAHQELWHPLETVLSNWIELIFCGKVVASSPDVPALFDCEKFGPWEWRPYGDAQVDTCVAAWDRLCKAIEARISSTSTTDDATIDGNTSHTSEPPPLVPAAVLDAASVPDLGFTRAFLTRARRPRFHRIAPGLVLPPADTAGFVAVQAYTSLPRSSPQCIPPVCLFPAATPGEDRPSSRYMVNLTQTTSPWLVQDFCEMSLEVNAGVYSDSIERNDFDNAEEGFRLLLPFSFSRKGARKSDGSFVGENAHTAESMAGLFQHGYKPFGGDAHRAQRLERLFECWRKLVEDGVWAVGPEGVEGTLDAFREADEEARWMDYYILPTW